jgi:hypothetical protein
MFEDFDLSVLFDDDGNLMPGALDGLGSGFPMFDDDGNPMPDAGFPSFDDNGNPMPDAGGSPGGGLPSLPRLPGLPGAGGGGGAGLNDIARLLGLTGGGGGGMSGLAGLLPLLATLFGGINANNATRDATDRMTGAVTDANAMLEDKLGGAMGGFKPYADAGAGAMAKLTGAPDSNMATKYGPISTGGPIQRGPIGQASNLAAGYRPIGQASNMAGGFNPLGSGRSLRQIGRG